MSISDSYDAIPYESTAFPETHPGHLACLARLYGIDSMPPTNCNVLELGCANGGNLIPMAARLPGSYFLGIELSPEQANEGSERIKELGLDNCEIRQMDIMDLHDDGKKFDYIITHGMYSWAPPQVRGRILELSSKLLSPRGIAYISFNALPGWRMRGMLRDMLLYQVRGISSPTEKLEVAQNYLEYLAAGLDDSESAHGDFIKFEIERIRNSHPSYLYHEYLETFNEPVLLKDFISAANDHGLDYVCDIDLALLGERAEQLLSYVDDPLERLQQLDFLLNRNFHQSLLCHEAQHPMRFPDMSRMADFAWISDLRAPRKLELRRIKTVPFTHAEGHKYEISHPLTKAALALLTENFPSAVAFDELKSRAQKWVCGDGGDAFAEQQDEMLNELFWLYAKGIIHARPIDMLDTVATPVEWQMDAVARQGILRGDGHITTIHHASIHLDQFAARIISYLDGNTGEEKLLDMLLQDVQPGGDLADLVDSAMPADKLSSHIEYHTQQFLALLRKHGVLG